MEKRISDKGLKGRVYLLDFVDDIENIYAASDIFVLPSVSEGFSLTTVEAMASGLPVIAADCIGPRDIIDDNVDGIILKERSPGTLSNEIAALLSDGHRRRELGEAARYKVSKMFNIADSVKEFENLFIELCGKGSR